MAERMSVADEALKKLADQLECSICLDSFTDPKLLRCFHVFCKKCLEPMVIQGQDQSSLRCPNCRRSTILPSSGVSGLQSAFHIHHLFEIQGALLKVKKGQEGKKTQCEKCRKRESNSFCRDCAKFICEVCNEMHQTWEDLTTHKVISLDQLNSDATNMVPPARKILFCSKHPGKELDFFCETESVLTCQYCIATTHRDHKFDLISDIFPKHRDTIVTHLEPIKQQLSTLSQAIQNLDTVKHQITTQQASIEVDIQREVKQLHEALEMMKTKLMGQLHQTMQKKLKILSIQRDEFELMQIQLNSCLEFISNSLKTGSEGEILAMEKPVVQQVKQMCAEYDHRKLQPQEQADVELIVSELLPACQQFGQVLSLAERKKAREAHSVTTAQCSQPLPMAGHPLDLPQEQHRGGSSPANATIGHFPSTRGFSPSTTPGHVTSGTPGHPPSGTPGHPSSTTRGHPSSTTHGHPSTTTPGNPTTGMPDHTPYDTPTGTPGHPSSNTPDYTPSNTPSDVPGYPPAGKPVGGLSGSHGGATGAPPGMERAKSWPAATVGDIGGRASLPPLDSSTVTPASEWTTDSPSGAHGAGATYSNITASRGHQGSHDSHGHLPASDIVSNPFANYHHGRGGGKDEVNPSSHSRRDRDATTRNGHTAEEKAECLICLGTFKDPVRTKCGHRFCRACIKGSIRHTSFCPTCRTALVPLVGKQPPGGTMKSTVVGSALPGYKGCSTIQVHYDIPDGIQSENHPHPGVYFTGVHRTAYLPNNYEGRLAHKLLKKAFDARLVFTVGDSITTGQKNVVVWNDIHHKTQMRGGPCNYGYPDPGYLKRLMEDLAAKGICPD